MFGVQNALPFLGRFPRSLSMSIRCVTLFTFINGARPFVGTESLETRWAAVMGTVHSDNWDCSADDRGIIWSFNPHAWRRLGPHEITAIVCYYLSYMLDGVIVFAIVPTYSTLGPSNPILPLP